MNGKQINGSLGPRVRDGDWLKGQERDSLDDQNDLDSGGYSYIFCQNPLNLMGTFDCM